MLFRTMAVGFSALILAGCAAPQTLAPTPSGITVEYNKNFTSHQDAVAIANEHCASYDKVASLRDTTISPSGNTYSRNFRCE